MSFLWKSEDGRTEVTLGFLIDEHEHETGVAVLEVLSPVYGPYDSRRQTLVDKIERVRHRVFGRKDVIDLSMVPLEVGATRPPGEFINLFTIYEQNTHRHRFVYVGQPAPDFKRDDMHWEEQLVIAAPELEIATKRG